MKSLVLLSVILSTTVVRGGVERAIKNLGIKNPRQLLNHLKGRKDGKQIYYVVDSIDKDSQGYLFYRQDLSLMVKNVSVVDGVYYPGDSQRVGSIKEELVRPEIKECLQDKIADGRCRHLENPLSRSELLAELGYDPLWDSRKIALIASTAKQLGLKSITGGSGANRTLHYLEQQAFAKIKELGGVRYAKLHFFLVANPKYHTVEGVSEQEIADLLGLEQLPNSFHRGAKKYLPNIEIWQLSSRQRIYLNEGVMDRALDGFIEQNEQLLKTKGYYTAKLSRDDNDLPIELPILLDRQYKALLDKAIERGKLAISNNSAFSGKDRRQLTWLFWPGYTPEEQLGAYLRSRGERVSFAELRKAFPHFLIVSDDKSHLPADYAIKAIIHGTGVRGETRRRAGGDLVPYLTKVAQEELGDHMDKLGILDGNGLPSFRRPAYGKEKARDIVKVISD